MNSLQSEILVIGAGSSGCAVASRLAEHGLDVLLIEAGEFIDDLPDAFNCDLTGRLDWGLHATISAGRVVAAPRGKAVGGSSVINTCIALRPDPWGFEHWNQIAAGWSWADVLPYFRKLERDVDFPANDLHGDHGPMNIVRWRPEELEAPSRWFHEAITRLGHTSVDDLNRPEASGVGIVPMNRVGDRRASADRAYLGSSWVRRGPRIEAGWHIDRLTMQFGRVNGAVGRRNGIEMRFFAEHTVLSAGSYATPGILFRSGIGAASHLQDHGIEVLHDLPGVGVGLHDHCQVYLEAEGTTSSQSCPALQVLARLTTSSSRHPNDIQLCILNRVDSARYVQGQSSTAHPVMLCALLMNSSSTGRVTLDRESPGHPRIEIDFMQTDEDRQRLREAVRMLVDVVDAGTVGEVVLREPFDVRAMSRAQLDNLILRRVQGTHHPMGTARMGASSDGLSVVDELQRVHSLDGLSIADASIIPISLNANIHLTCTMIGERHADQLLMT